MVVRIGVIADTHVPDRQPAIPDAVLKGLSGVDMIIHAGDLTGIYVLHELEKIAPIHAMSGNMDSPEVRSSLQRELRLKVLDKTIAVFHGASSHWATEDEARARYPEADCVVFGHTHRSLCERAGETLIFNPGPSSTSIGSRPSYGFLTVREGRLVSGEIIRF